MKEAGGKEQEVFAISQWLSARGLCASLWCAATVQIHVVNINGFVCTRRQIRLQVRDLNKRGLLFVSASVRTGNAGNVSVANAEAGRMRAKQAGLPLIHNDWETMHGNLWQPQLSGGGAIYFLYTRAALHCLACRLAVAIASLQSHLGTFSYLRAFECIVGANRNHPCRNSSASSWKNLVSQRSGRPAHPSCSETRDTFYP